MIGGYACQCRASYYTTLFRVIWQLCSPQTAHILTLPMQASIDRSAPRESSHAYRHVVHRISHHKHAHHSDRHFAQGSGRLNAHHRLFASRSQDQRMQCCCYHCFHAGHSYSRVAVLAYLQRVAKTVSSANCDGMFTCSGLLLC